MKEWTKLLLIVAGFLIAYYTPWDHDVIRRSGLEAFMMLQEYARQHVLTCLIPAFFHRRGDRRLRLPGIGSEVLWRQGEQDPFLFRRLCFGNGPGRLLLHGIAAVRRYLHAGRRDRTGDGLPLFGAGHQRAGHRPDGKGSGLAARPGPGCRRGSLLRRRRPADGLHLPKGGRRSRYGGFHPSGRRRQAAVPAQDALYMLTMVLILVFAAFARPAQGETGSGPSFSASSGT